MLLTAKNFIGVRIINLWGGSKHQPQKAIM